MNISEWLIRTARRVPNSPALMNGERLIANYRSFADEAGAFAAYLLDVLGVQPSDRIAIYMPNRVEYLIAMYGVWFAGCTVVPINAKLHWREALDILRDCEARAVVGCDASGDDFWLAVDQDGQFGKLSFDEAGFLAALAKQRPIGQPRPRVDADPAWIFYTSGTTGKPKGATLSHGNLMAMSLTYLADVDEVTSADAILYAAPMSHGAGLYNFMHVLRGSRHIVPASGGFDAAEVLQLARSCGPISMFAAPTIVRRLTSVAKTRGEDGEGIRTIVYGGGPMYVADLRDALEIFGNKFAQIYGQGETPMCISVLQRHHLSDNAHPRWLDRLASVGIPQSCVEVLVVDQSGKPLPSGEVGEIIVSGPTVMNGYWKDPEASERTLRDGWLWTGDMGSFDDEGFLTLKDRSKDLIISGGSNIYPREIEECLLMHPAVAEVAVLGEQHPEWGEIVVAFVAPEKGARVTEQELDSLCLANIARFKRPKKYFFEAELPKNNYGKILKSELRKNIRVEP